jgi:hypothetical protein
VHFDGTITLGTLLSAIAIVFSIATAYVKGTRWLEEQLTTFKLTLEHHGQQLERHASRMDGYEQKYSSLSETMARWIGRMEASDRRGAPRTE